MKRVITFVEAQSYVGNIIADPGKYSVFDYAYAYTLADKFFKMAIEKDGREERKDEQEMWMAALQYLLMLLEENEEFACIQATEVAQKVIDAEEVQDPEEIVKLMYLAYAYLEISCDETQMVSAFWLGMYNGCAAFFRTNAYQPGVNLLSSREEAEQHRAHMQSLLPTAQSEEEVNALLDGILELDKVLKTPPVTL